MRCALCPGVHKCLPPDGPPHATTLFVGEAPGVEEERRGRVFVGKTGREVDDHYLPVAGLRRGNVMITNAIRCLPSTPRHKLDMSKAAHVALLQSCAHTHLYPLIERGRFQLLVPMGAVACRAVCPEVDLDLQHGMPVETEWGIPAFPMWHPARGIHEPKKMLDIRTDYVRLRRYLRGELALPVDNYDETDYVEVVEPEEVTALDPQLPLACDTESSRASGAFCLTYSQAPGMGRLLRTTRQDLLDAFQLHLHNQREPVYFHNWLYDAQVVAELGLHIRPSLIRDSMSLVYHLGNLPQGLKALAYRELGMAMQDFDDLVTPYSRQRVIDYYELAALEDWPKPEPQLARNPLTQKWELYRPQGMNTKLKRFFTDVRKYPEKDVFGMWDNWVDEQKAIEDACGPWPGKDILHVPFERVLHYACRDVDALIRLLPLLERMRRGVQQGLPQEEWRYAA